MLEDIPRHGPELLRGAAQGSAARSRAAAEKELADLYPADPDGATPIAYLWARTVRCEAPNCGAEIPLLRSLLAVQEDQAAERALRAQVRRGPPDASLPRS